MSRNDPIQSSVGINIGDIIKSSLVAKTDALSVAKSYFPPIQFSALSSRSNSTYEQKLKIAKKVILYIMDIDKDCRKIDKQAQAEKIAVTALDVGVPPEVVGALIMQETHFSTDNADMNRGNGIGPMQVTNINIQDMYIRPQAYDPEIKNFVGVGKQYKTFEDALKAKINNPKVDLGSFGNKFFEFYKQNRELFNKYKGVYSNASKIAKEKYIKTLSNYNMNVYLGCWIYKSKLRGHTEKEAIINYNGSKLKYEYEHSVSDTINHVRRTVPELKMFKA